MIRRGTKTADFPRRGGSDSGAECPGRWCRSRCTRSRPGGNGGRIGTCPSGVDTWFSRCGPTEPGKDPSMPIFRRTLTGALRSRAAAVLGAVALATSGLVGLSASPASAIPRTNYCGSAYGFLKSWPIGWRGEVGGYIDVYYNSSNGYNCVISRTNDSVINSAWD